MNASLKEELEKYGPVEMDTVTWVPEWYNYWHCYTGQQDRDAIIAVLSKKYQDYSFSKGEAHINNVIYEVIHIYKKV